MNYKFISKFKTVWVLLTAILFFAVFTLVKKTKYRKIEISDDLVLSYFNDGSSLKNGRLIFSLLSFQDTPVSTTNKSYLIALSDSGDVLYQRKAISPNNQAATYNFGVLDDNFYSFFIGTSVGPLTNQGTVYLLTKSFDSVLTGTIPEKAKDLDGHDIAASPDGSIFYLFENRGVTGSIFNNEIQKWDKNGNIIFTWDARKQFGKSFPDLKLPEVNPFHLNSIFIDSDKNIIASLSNLNAVIKIEYPSGKILWKISKDVWTFKNDSFGGFQMQHSVKIVDNGHLLMFDNGDLNRPSRAVEYSIDFKNRSLRQVWEYRLTGPKAIRKAEGSVQRLSNGNTLIGWGRPAEALKKPHLDTIFSEVTKDGRVVRQLDTKDLISAYRVTFEESK